MKQYARSQYAPLLTRISLEVRSSQLKGQILNENYQNEHIHVKIVQGCHFLGQKPAGTFHNAAEGL